MARLQIVIPFYNAAATIARTVRSLAILAPASREETQIIAVDDGSQDGSAALLAAEMAGIAGLSFLLLQQENAGSAVARNVALAALEEGWVLFLDADDELTFDPLPLLERSPSASALLFAATLVRAGKILARRNPAPVEKDGLDELFTAANPYVISSVIFQRRCLETFFCAELHFLEDWAFWATNPALFTQAATFPAISLSTIHVGVANKSADQRQNGRYRLLAAAAIGRYWQGRLSRKSRNNLAVQAAIGRVQSGEAPRSWGRLLQLPVSPPLYAKMLIYFFLYRLYLKVQPYR